VGILSRAAPEMGSRLEMLHHCGMAKLTLEQKCHALKNLRLFTRLADADVEAIAEVATTRELKSREELFHKGSASSQIYVVVSGRLKVISTSDVGSDLMFSLAGPGEVIGEIGLLVDRDRTATVIAMEQSVLIVVDRRDFEGLLGRRPAVALELLTVLAERLARISEFLEDTHFLNLPVRLAKKLVNFAELHGVAPSGESGGEVIIDLKFSQEEWGDLVGTTRESINKQFRSWTKEGLISLDKGKVVIHDLSELEKLADFVVM
jgi:CRP/FNR family cyclic AMP-dependent transcriptional regulator